MSPFQDKSHYLTIAAFRIEAAQTSNEVTIDDHMPFNAVIRKVCICGASIEFEQESRKWLCSTSGVELKVNRINCAPLMTEANLENLDVSSLKEPHCSSLVKFDEDGNLIALLKVETKDQWAISDPLEMFENISVKPFETDLLLRWFLSVKNDIGSSLSFEIYWNLVDPNDRRIVESLYSLHNITIYFVNADSFAVIGATVLELYQPSIQSAVKQAFALIAGLPNDENERREQLGAFALGQEASMYSFAEKMGICPAVTGFIFGSSSIESRMTEMSQHIKDCPLCQRSNCP